MSVSLKTLPVRGDAAVVAVRGRRSPRLPWLAVGVVLVGIGAVAAGLVAQSAGRRSAVLVAARDVAAGHVMTAADVRVAELGVDRGAAVVPAGDRRVVVGRVATAPIPAGSVLNGAGFASAAAWAPGTVVAGVLLSPGGVPVGNLRAGDRVRMVDVGSPGDAGGVLGSARVYAVGAGTQPGSVFVSLAVDDAVSERVVDAGAGQRLRLLLLGPGDTAAAG